MAKDTDAGALSEQLTIQQPIETADNQGGRVVAWSDLATVWGQLIPMGASEQFQAESIGSLSRYRFRVYVRADVRPTYRVVWTPRWPPGQAAITLQIGGVQLEAARRFMVLECAAVQ